MSINNIIALEEVLPSKRYEGGYNFVGIIDLLLLTNKGFIIIDYKTSSTVPEWDKYLEQIYSYEYLLSKKFITKSINIFFSFGLDCAISNVIATSVLLSIT